MVYNTPFDSSHRAKKEYQEIYENNEPFKSWIVLPDIDSNLRGSLPRFIISTVCKDGIPISFI